MVVLLQREKKVKKVINFPPSPFIYDVLCNSPFSRQSVAGQNYMHLGSAAMLAVGAT